MLGQRARIKKNVAFRRGSPGGDRRQLYVGQPAFGRVRRNAARRALGGGEVCHVRLPCAQVVMTIFWLGRLTRGRWSGPSLDLAAFSNLVDVPPPTPLSRSEYSSPSGSTVFLPQQPPPEPSDDGFFRYRGGGGGGGGGAWGMTSSWNQQVAVTDG